MRVDEGRVAAEILGPGGLDEVVAVKFVDGLVDGEFFAVGVVEGGDGFAVEHLGFVHVLDADHARHGVLEYFGQILGADFLECISVSKN